MVIDRTDTGILDGFVHAVVSPEATLVSTDEHSGYRHLGRTFNHGVVRHSAGEYVNGNIHSNGIEGLVAAQESDCRYSPLRIAEASEPLCLRVHVAL